MASARLGLGRATSVSEFQSVRQLAAGSARDKNPSETNRGLKSLLNGGTLELRREPMSSGTMLETRTPPHTGRELTTLSAAGYVAVKNGRVVIVRGADVP